MSSMDVYWQNWCVCLRGLFISVIYSSAPVCVAMVINYARTTNNKRRDLRPMSHCVRDAQLFLTVSFVLRHVEWRVRLSSLRQLCPDEAHFYDKKAEQISAKNKLRVISYLCLDCISDRICIVIYIVSQKVYPFSFCDYSVKYKPIFMMFGIIVVEKMCKKMTYSSL